MVEADTRYKAVYKSKWVKRTFVATILSLGLIINLILYFRYTSMISLVPISHDIGLPDITGPSFYGFVFPSGSIRLQWDILNLFQVLYYEEEFIIPILAMLAFLSLFNLLVRKIWETPKYMGVTNTKKGRTEETITVVIKETQEDIKH